MRKFSKLSFDKKTVAKLNEQQLSSVKGGNNSIQAEKGDCTTTAVTKNCSTTSTTSIVS